MNFSQQDGTSCTNLQNGVGGFFNCLFSLPTGRTSLCTYVQVVAIAIQQEALCLAINTLLLLHIAHRAWAFHSSYQKLKLPFKCQEVTGNLINTDMEIKWDIRISWEGPHWRLERTLGRTQESTLERARDTSAETQSVWMIFVKFCQRSFSSSNHLPFNWNPLADAAGIANTTIVHETLAEAANLSGNDWSRAR